MWLQLSNSFTVLNVRFIQFNHAQSISSAASLLSFLMYLKQAIYLKIRVFEVSHLDLFL